MLSYVNLLTWELFLITSVSVPLTYYKIKILLLLKMQLFKSINVYITL